MASAMRAFDAIAPGTDLSLHARELVRIHDERIARQAAEHQAAPNK